MITQTVILAAGVGARLGSAEAGVPKPLLTVGGSPLFAHALGHAAASGCGEAIVVIQVCAAGQYENRHVRVGREIARLHPRCGEGHIGDAVVAVLLDNAEVWSSVSGDRGKDGESVGRERRKVPEVDL